MATPNFELRSLKPSLVLFLWDGFTGANALAGAVNVKIGGTRPSFQSENAGFVFPNLEDGSYIVNVQSASGEPYYLPLEIPLSLPFPRPSDTVWNPSPTSSAYPDIVLADPNKSLDDPDQTPAYLGQRALATLLPSTGYPFPAGATLVRGVVTGGGKPLTGALVTSYPSTQPGQYSVVIVDPSGARSNAETLAVAQGPSIDSIDPAAVIAGSGDFTLLVEGGGFIPGAVVQWNRAALPAEFLNADALTAQVNQSMVRAASEIKIAAVNPNGRSSNTVGFSVAAAPVILSVSPQTVTAGSSGLTCSVIGRGFVAGSQVLLAGTAVPTEFVNSTQLNTQVGATQIANASLVSVLVVTPGQTPQSSNAKTLSVVSQPVIHSLEPAAVVAGSQAFTLTINGSGFVAGTKVQIGGTAASTQVLGANQATASVTAGQIGSAGQVTISVSNPNGTTSGTQSLLVLAAPVITTLDPTVVAGGYTVFSLVIRGSGYVSDSTVELNGVPLSAVFIDSTELHAHVPRNGYTTGDDGAFVLFFDGVNGRAQTIALTVSHPNYANTKSVSVAVTRGATASVQIDMGT